MAHESNVSRREFLAGTAAAALALPQQNIEAAALSGAQTAPLAVAAQHQQLNKAELDAIAEKVSNWGRWGKDDQLGTVNLITPAKRKQALSLPREGITVSLSHPQDTEKSDGNPAPLIHTVRVNVVDGPGSDEYPVDTYTMDYHGGSFTHMDALCHCFHGGYAYNGVTLDSISARGAEKLSIEPFKDGILSRGVLIDIPRLKGLPYLEPDAVIYPADLDAWEAHAKVKTSSGDILFLRTGRWARQAAKGPWNFMLQSAGLHASCIPWLRQRDIAVLASDGGSDAMGLQYEGFVQPIHSIVLSRMGTPLLDCCDLEALGETANRLRRWEFLAIAAPMVIPEGTGSPLNPLAVF